MKLIHCYFQIQLLDETNHILESTFVVSPIEIGATIETERHLITIDDFAEEEKQAPPPANPPPSNTGGDFTKKTIGPRRSNNIMTKSQSTPVVAPQQPIIKKNINYGNIPAPTPTNNYTQGFEKASSLNNSYSNNSNHNNNQNNNNNYNNSNKSFPSVPRLPLSRTTGRTDEEILILLQS